jgi:hypothetical protein
VSSAEARRVEGLGFNRKGETNRDPRVDDQGGRSGFVEKEGRRVGKRKEADDSLVIRIWSALAYSRKLVSSV